MTVMINRNSSSSSCSSLLSVFCAEILFVISDQSQGANIPFASAVNRTLSGVEEDGKRPRQFYVRRCMQLRWLSDCCLPGM